MELVLDRKISDQRIYPAVDIFLSGTRREELLLSAEDLHKISVIRRGLAGHKPIEAIERLLFFIRKYSTNADLLRNIPLEAQGPAFDPAEGEDTVPGVTVRRSRRTNLWG
jgi:transcription termination factor Rho